MGSCVWDSPCDNFLPLNGYHTDYNHGFIEKTEIKLFKSPITTSYLLENSAAEHQTPSHETKHDLHKQDENNQSTALVWATVTLKWSLPLS